MWDVNNTIRRLLQMHHASQCLYGDQVQASIKPAMTVHADCVPSAQARDVGLNDASQHKLILLPHGLTAGVMQNAAISQEVHGCMHMQTCQQSLQTWHNLH